MQIGDQFQQRFLASEAVYEGFLTIFNDRNVLHTDEAFAVSKGFKNKVMHGNILGGFVSYFVGECLPVKNVIIHKQEMLFPRPVYLGDVLEFSASISDYSEAVNAFEIKFKFHNEAKEKVCFGKVQVGLI